MATISQEADQGAANLPAALMALTVVTGIVDAVSVLGFGVFTSNMTGNVFFLGFALAGAHGFSIARSLTSLVAFLAGAAIGGRICAAMASASRRRWLLTLAACEAVLLFAAALASIDLDIRSAAPASRLYAVIVLIAVAMGLRNATVRRLDIPDLTSTVVTLTLTGLAADSSLAGGANPRIGRRVASVLLLLAGAVIGTLLLRLGTALPIVLSWACALTASTVYFAVPPSTASAGDAEDGLAKGEEK
jgi:uncharacterized membrane protein YoaK (UPF0700 family)